MTHHTAAPRLAPHALRDSGSAAVMLVKAPGPDTRRTDCHLSLSLCPSFLSLSLSLSLSRRDLASLRALLAKAPALGLRRAHSPVVFEAHEMCELLAAEVRALSRRSPRRRTIVFHSDRRPA